MNENSVWFILLPFVVVWFWVFFVKRPANKTCPDCAQPLSPIQSPFTKTNRMWWEGGYICANCGCEVNLDGQKVPAGTAPQQRSVRRGIGMLVIAVVPALIMLYVGFQHTTPTQPAPAKLIAAPSNFVSDTLN